MRGIETHFFDQQVEGGDQGYLFDFTIDVEGISACCRIRGDESDGVGLAIIDQVKGIGGDADGIQILPFIRSEFKPASLYFDSECRCVGHDGVVLFCLPTLSRKTTS